MDLSRSSKELSNMNIFTFVKEVYSSLKHITTRLYSNNDKLDSQHKDIKNVISRLESKLDHIIQEQRAIKEMIHSYYNADQNIGNDIQHKMESLLSNTVDVADPSGLKLSLKPEDLTLANVDESNYSFADVQNSLDTNDTTFQGSLTEGLLDNTDDLFASINLEEEDNNNKTTEENINDLVY